MEGHYLPTSTAGKMSAIVRDLGLSSGIPRDEFVTDIKRHPISMLKNCRLELFEEAVTGKLADPRDSLVNRINSAIRPLNLKLAEDIWTLLIAVENNAQIPRSILKNGKRSLSQLQESRASIHSTPLLSTSVHQPPEDLIPPLISTPSSAGSGSTSQPTQSAADSVPTSLTQSSQSSANSVSNYFIAKEINLIKEDMAGLRSEVTSLRKSITSVQNGQDLELMKQELALLHNKIYGLPSATTPRVSTNPTSPPVVVSPQLFSNNLICVQSWNCRGISNGAPYVQHMAEEGAHIIVLCEHWLWPYQLHKLETMHPNYLATGVADKRLSHLSFSGGVVVFCGTSL